MSPPDPVTRSVGAQDLDSWCRRHLKSAPVDLVFTAGQLAQVTGLQLADGRRVVVKARAFKLRLKGCMAVQEHLWKAGFPCPQPLAGPAPLGSLAATAETFVPGGEPLENPRLHPELFARALHSFVRSAPPAAAVPSLAPPPSWIWWDHPESGVWPAPATTSADLNRRPGPAWLDDTAGRARTRLRRQSGALAVVGHADFESQNLRWTGDRLHVAYDFDSVAALPEPAVAGAASAVFPTAGPLADAASIDESAAFLEQYEACRSRPFSDEERELCWACGLWVLAYNARVQLAEGRDELAGRLILEAKERLKRSGA